MYIAESGSHERPAWAKPFWLVSFGEILSYNKDMEMPEMNLDDPKSFQSAAQRKVLAEIEALPDSLPEGFAVGNSLELDSPGDLKHVVISGTGNSIIGADLLAAYVSALCP